MEGYIIVRPITGMTSKERCEAINEELWRISRPLSIQNPDDVTSKVFGEVKLDESTFGMRVYTDYVIKVHPDNDISNLVSLFPNLSQIEKDNLANYITNSSEFEFINIIPSDTNVYSFQEIIDLGYFPEDIF